MKKYLKDLKPINVVAIVAFLFTYAVAFCAFNTESLSGFNAESRFETSFSSLMVIYGFAFSLTVASYVIIRKLDKITSGVIVLAASLLSVLSMWYALKEVDWIRDEFLSSSGGAGVKVHCTVAEIMCYVIIVIMIVTAVQSLCRMLLCKMDNDIEPEKEPKVVGGEASFAHLLALVVLIFSIFACSFYMYSSDMVQVLSFAVLSMFVIGIPAAVILSAIVKKWIEAGKNVFAVGSYILYLHIVFGCIYRLFANGLSTRNEGMWFIFNQGDIVAIVNAAVALIIIVYLIIQGVRDSWYGEYIEVGAEEDKKSSEENTEA